MNKLLCFCCLNILLAILPYANAGYPLPPPNDTRVYGVHPPIVKHKHHHKIVQHKHHVKIAHYKRHYPHHRKPQRTVGMFIYYALPATACCGEAWTVRDHCCAESGEWQTSPYAVFGLAEDDLVYSATNDDAYRPFEIDRNVVVNEGT